MTFADIVDIFGSGFRSTLLPTAEYYIVFLSPILLAICLWFIFWHVWIRYVQLKQFLGIKYTILELKLPKDTFKSPLAMETVFQSIHNTADGSAYAKFWRGETRPWYSFELISVEGQVKFLIWTEDRRKSNLMSALYSQYPGIEITERADYANSVHFDPKEIKIWAAEFKFNKPDPYPIKTYVDYGLDRDPKEEFKVDPLTHVIEWLGSLRPNEQAWFQFIIRAHVKEQRKAGHLWKKTDRWKDEAEAEVNKILLRDPKTKASRQVSEAGFPILPTFSEGERDIVKAIERSVTKLPFDVCVRAVYLAKRSAFDTPFGLGGLISSMKQFNTEHLNGFRPNGSKWMAQFDYPWQDFMDFRRNYLSRKVLMAYRRRSAFYPPYKSPSLVLNTEELATIFHFPGSVSSTPGLARVTSKKSEAPTNLPI
ncbi:MAG: hypothetical protein WCV82_01170 [Candidatus Paceibacterota bacterium]